MVAAVGARILVDDVLTAISHQVFLSNGTWTKPPGAQFVRIYVTGGGGGGGGVQAAAAGQNCKGGGGGAGATGILFTEASNLGDSEPIVIGAAGVGVSAANGTNGGTSSFGSGPTLVEAAGGKGGLLGASSAAAFGVLGGEGGLIVSGAEIVCAGGPGEYGFGSGSLGASGSGGASFWGGGAQGHATGTVGVSNAGRTAISFGAGGSGALATSGGVANAGGDGYKGVVIVITYV